MEIHVRKDMTNQLLNLHIMKNRCINGETIASDASFILRSKLKPTIKNSAIPRSPPPYSPSVHATNAL